MELKPTFLERSFIVEVIDTSSSDYQILTGLGMVVMVLYPRRNNLAHNVGNLMMLRKIEFECIDDHTPETGYQHVQSVMLEVADVIRKVKMGGTPSRYDPRRGNHAPLSLQEKGGESDTLFFVSKRRTEGR